MTKEAEWGGDRPRIDTLELKMDQSLFSQALMMGNDCDFQAFTLTYYDRIFSICRRYARDENDAADLTQEFLTHKVFEKGLIAKYQAKMSKVQDDGEERIPFRRYLYRSVTLFCIDQGRKQNHTPEQNQDPIEFDFIEKIDASGSPGDIDYAMSILHRAFSKVRNHYAKKDKLHYWEIFKETLFEKRMKRQKISVAETVGSVEDHEFHEENSKEFYEEILRKYLPGVTKVQKIFEIQQTVKRMLISTLDVIFEAETDDKTDPEEKNNVYQDWQRILMTGDRALYSALQAALRVGPTSIGETASGMSLSISMDMAMPSSPNDITSDELGYLLNYRLEMPLTEWIDSKKLISLIPIGSPFKPQTYPRNVRELSLGVILDPTLPEAMALENLNVAELLRFLKDHSKKLANVRDNPVPVQIFTLFYTMISVLALDRYHVKLHSIPKKTLTDNIRWYLREEWLDDRIKRLFKHFITDTNGYLAN
jgi:hypothetical protein